MKRIILASVISMSLVLSSAMPAFADEVQTQTSQPEQNQTATVTQTDAQPAAQPTDTTSVVPDIKPDSPLYFVKGIFEKVQLFLTFNETEKAKLLDAIAQERLQDLKELDPQKQAELAQEISKVYANAIDRLTYIAEKRRAEGKDVSDISAILEKAAQRASEVQIKDEAKDRLDESSQKALIEAAVVKGIDPKVVSDLRAKGYGYGKIAIVVGLSEKSGKSLDEVVKLLDENKGIGKTARILGVKPGDFKSIKRNIGEKRDEAKQEVLDQDKVKEEQDEDKDEVRDHQQNINRKQDGKNHGKLMREQHGKKGNQEDDNENDED